MQNGINEMFWGQTFKNILFQFKARDRVHGKVHDKINDKVHDEVHDKVHDKVRDEAWASFCLLCVSVAHPDFDLQPGVLIDRLHMIINRALDLVI